MKNTKTLSIIAGILITLSLFILLALSQYVKPGGTEPTRIDDEVQPVAFIAPDIKIPDDLKDPVNQDAQSIPDAPKPTIEKPQIKQADIIMELTKPDGGLTTSGLISGSLWPDTTIPDEFFDLKELDEVPAVTKAGEFEFPINVREASGKGSMEIEIRIDKSGRVTVINVPETEHTAFIKAVKDLATSTRFTIPTRDNKPGIAVQAKGRRCPQCQAKCI